MKCTHCNKKKATEAMEVRVCGNVLNVTVCADCAKNLSSIMGYASTFPTASAMPAEAPRPSVSKKPSRVARPMAKRPVPKPAVENARFDRHALSPEEIAKTQALRPSVRMPDSPVLRDRDSIDKIATKERCVLYGAGSSGELEMRLIQKRLIPKAQAQLGTMNVKLVTKRNGCEYVFEAA